MAHDLADQPLILIERPALETARADAARYAARSERGGILLGSRRGQHLHVESVTTPSRWDRGSMFAFHRGVRGHQAVALRRWKASGGTTDWLGEWHSHPESYPRPSSIDITSWCRLARDHGAPMLFIIIGFVEVWVGRLGPRDAEAARYMVVEKGATWVAYAEAR